MKTSQHIRLIGVQGVATTSVNPNKKSAGAATISVNPVRHTSRANASGEEKEIATVVRVKLI